jgi:hypothetical protein
MDIDVDFLVSAPSDLEHPEQWSEVCQWGICPNILAHTAAIASKIDKHKVINVLEDLESPNP